MAEGTNSKQDVSNTEEKDERKKHYCPNHPDEELSRYCRDCSKLLCEKCLSDNHNQPDHLVQTFEEVDPWARQMLQEHIVRSQAKLEEVQRYHAYLQHLRQENERRRDEECAQIDRNVETICAMVRQTGNEALGRFYIKLLSETLGQRGPDKPDEPELD